MPTNPNRLAALVVLHGFFGWGIVAPAAGQEIQFRFHRPDDFPEYVSTYKNTKIIELDKSVKRTTVVEGKSRIKVMKTPTGYKETAVPILFRTTQDGKPVDNPIQSFIQKTTLTAELDSDGKLLEVRGLEGIVERLQAELPEDLPPNFATLVSEETIVNTVKQEWQGRVGEFLGVDAEIGEVWTGEKTIPLPVGGTVSFHTVTKLAEQVKFGEVDCVRIEFFYDTDAGALNQLLGGVLDDLATLAKSEATHNVSAAKITGKGRRIVDPATMMIYSEIIERTITMKMNIPGQGEVDMTLFETREYGVEELGR